jgi:hypothetical protein
MKIKLLSPLVYFYAEEYDADEANNVPEEYDFGHGFVLKKIDKHSVIKPLLDAKHGHDVMSPYMRGLIMDFASHAITREYDISEKGVADTGKSTEILETKRLLSLLKMALGIGKKSHLIFQDFHVKDGDTQSCLTSSLNLEGSYWAAHSYYPEDIDVTYTYHDLNVAKTIFNKLVDLSGDYSRAFNACYYFEMARLKGDRDYRLQFTLLVTSLESIFNTGASQISETLALRYVHMMFDKPKDRLETYTNLREIYKLRSHIVHGQQMPKRFLDHGLQDRLLGDLEFRVRKILNLIFSEDLVNQINSKNVEDYFTKLTLDLNQ